MIQDIRVPWSTPKIPPERVAKAIANGIRRNRAFVIIPKRYLLLGALNSLVPRFLDRAYRILRIEGETTVTDLKKRTG
jgi:hypothetical protein